MLNFLELLKGAASKLASFLKIRKNDDVSTAKTFEPKKQKSKVKTNKEFAQFKKFKIKRFLTKRNSGKKPFAKRTLALYDRLQKGLDLDEEFLAKNIPPELYDLFVNPEDHLTEWHNIYLYASNNKIIDWSELLSDMKDNSPTVQEELRDKLIEAIRAYYLDKDGYDRFNIIYASGPTTNTPKVNNFDDMMDVNDSLDLMGSIKTDNVPNPIDDLGFGI